MFEVVLVETQNTCNRSCWFCKFGNSKQQAVVQLDDNLIDKIATELREINFNGRISPFGINEPLLDRRIVEIVKKFRGACPQAYISIVSNGDFLFQKLFQELVENGLDGLAISIYETSAIARLEQKIDSKSMQSLNLIDMRLPIYLENRGGEIKLAAKPTKGKCLRPSNMLVIKANGDVCLCCADMEGKIVFGNIKNSSLQEIWHSLEFRNVRNKLQRSREGLQLCKGCSHDGSTSSIYYPPRFIWS